MAANESTKQRRPPRRRWPEAEKRRIVELTLRAGASVNTIASEISVHPTSVYHWRALYRAGMLDPKRKAQHVARQATRATFLPVNVVATPPTSPLPTRPGMTAVRAASVQLVLASGAMLRIESDVLDAALVCALVTELRR